MALSTGHGGGAEMTTIMSETGKPVEEDFSSVPLMDRVEHKNFKARQSAYLELVTKFSRTGSDDDPIFRSYNSGDMLRRWVTDGHAVAQEKGLDAAIALVQFAGEGSARTRQEVMPAIVDKCLGASRPQTKTKGIELAMMYVEVENGGEGVVVDVLKGLDAKSPKAVAGSVQCLKEIVSAFGTKSLGDIRPLTGSLPKMFDHKDKVVRENATQLCQALYRYLGPVLPPLLAELKPAQLKDLQVKFDEMDAAGENGKCKPDRLTRKERREMEAKEAASAGGAGGTSGEGAAAAAVEEEIDPMSLVEAVDIVPKLPENFLAQITATKWSEKVEACSEMKAEVTKVLKIRNSADLAPYVEALASKLKESHAAVIAAAVGVLTELAKRIEDKGFGKYKGVVLPAAMLKFTEKRAIPILAQLLDDTFACCELNDVIEECATQSKNKAAAVKENSMAFLVRCLCLTKRAPRKDDVEPIVKICIGALGDAGELIRKQGILGLAAMQKLMGERIINSFLEEVPELQKKLVADAVSTIEVQYKPGAAPPAGRKTAGLSGPPPPSKKPVSKAPARALAIAKPPLENPTSWAEEGAQVETMPIAGQYKDFMDDPNAFPSGDEPPPKPRGAPPARLANKLAPKKDDAPAARAGPPSRAPAKPAVAAGKVAPPPIVSGPEVVQFKHTPEEALAMAEGAIPEEARTKYASSVWKERIEALDIMIAWVKDGTGKDAEAEVIARFFEKALAGGEKLIQVMVKIFELFVSMAAECPSFGKAAASLSIAPMVDKMGDLKAKKMVGDALILYAEKISLGFVLSQAFQPMIKLKVAKAQTEALVWVKQAVSDFGIGGVAMKDLVSFLKIGLQNSQAAVRAAAIEALVVVKLFIGPEVLSFLEDLNPQLLSTITSEFEKVDGQTAPAPTRTSAGVFSAGSGGKRKGGEDPLDQLVPRVDLDKLVKDTTFVADCRSDSFKERKAGADALLAILEIKSNTRLKANMGDAGMALKGRMSDSNLGVKMTCLAIISRIAVGMGAGFAPHAKLLTPPIALLLCDQKAMTRNAALETLGNMAKACESMDTMIPGLATAMEAPNSVARGLIGNFIIGTFTENMPGRGTDLSPLMQPIFLSLEDKIADARKAATLLLPYVIANVGYASLTDKASTLKPASRTTVMTALQAAKAVGLPASRAEVKVAPVAVSTAVPAARTGPLSHPKTMLEPAPIAGPAAQRAGSMATKANALRPPFGMSVEVEELPRVKSGQLAAKTRIAARNGGDPGPGFAAGIRSAVMQAAAAAPPVDRVPPFITMDLEAKQQRAKRDVSRWNFETQSPAQLMDYLHKQMDGHVNNDIILQLFSADRMAEQDHMTGLAALEDFFCPNTSFYGLPMDSMQALRLANSDLAVKYAALRMHDGSTQMINKCLELLGHIVHVVDDAGGAGFSDTETNALLPALIGKLGDKKFAERLASIFSVIDRAVPASKVLQYYVDYGVGSHNSKTRATALENLAQLIRRRGDVAASTSAGPRLYKRIAEQIASPDAATRSAALDCMAYLHKHTGDNMMPFVSELKPKERDMLNNRIVKMAAAPALRAVQSSVPQVRASSPRTGPTTPSRGPSHRDSPTSSPSPDQGSRFGGGTMRRPSAVAASASSNSSPTSDPGPPIVSRAPSGLPRIPQSRLLHRKVQPCENAEVVTPSGSGCVSSYDDLRSTISNVTSPDPDTSVNALKRLRSIMEQSPESVDAMGDELISVITVQFRRILSRHGGLQDPKMFRLLKHLVETLNSLCDNEKLVFDLGVNTMRGLMDQLTLGLIGTDSASESIIRDMSRHLNNTIVRFFSSGKRSVVFESFFTLFQQIALDFDPMTMESAIETRHAELVLKCIWKRSRTAEDDLVKGLLDPKDVFRIVESFLQAIPPKNWRLRATQKVPLGDMPLRTIKVLIQHIGTHCGPDLAVEKLHEAFGDRAADTIVYEYVYRLIKAQTANAEAGPSRPASRASNGRSSKTDTPPISVETVAAAATPTPASPAIVRVTLVEDELDAQLDGLVRAASSANGINEGIPLLYDFLRSHPEKREKYEQMLDQNLGADTRYRMFIKRKLDRLESENQPAAKTGPLEGAKAEEPVRQAVPLTANFRQTNRASVGPRASIPADADDDTRLALLKDKFQFFAQTGTNE